MSENTENLNIQSEDSIEKESKGSQMKKTKLKYILISLVVVLLGVGSGYALYQQGIGVGGQKVNKQSSGKTEEEIQVEKGVVVGVKEPDTFKDTAEGKLKKGGVDGEGSHHLVRPGGESQNVYLTSSIVDLDRFVGRKIKVWGETFAGQKAGWLMDVGRLKVLN